MIDISNTYNTNVGKRKNYHSMNMKTHSKSFSNPANLVDQRKQHYDSKQNMD